VEKLNLRKSTPAGGANATTNATHLIAVPAIDASSTIPSDEYRHLIEKFNDLHKKHQEVLRRLKYTEKKNVIVMQKNKEMKETVLAWQKFSDRHQSRKLKAKSEEKNVTDQVHVPSIEDDHLPTLAYGHRSSTVTTPTSLAGFDMTSPAPMQLIAQTNRLMDDTFRAPIASPQQPNRDKSLPQMSPESEGSRTVVPGDHGQGPVLENVETIDFANVHCNQTASADKIPSSQTTEDEIAAEAVDKRPQPTEAEENDDLPVFVSERSLKRKRPNQKRLASETGRTSSDGTPVKPFRVKEEKYSSPPPPLHAELLRNETLDLDELGPNAISTPRHRLRNFDSRVVGTLRQQRSTSVPLIKEELVDETAAQSRRTNNNIQIHSDSVSGDPRVVDEPADRTPVRSNILRSLDPNTRSAGGESEAPNKRRRKDKGLEFLSESGEEEPPQDENCRRLTPDVARSKFNRKFKIGGKGVPESAEQSRYVKTPTSAPSRLTAQVPTPPSSTSRLVETPSGRPTARRELPEALTTPRTVAPSGSRPVWPRIHKAAVQKPQDQTPLRTKPLNELRLSDFKVNPSYNQGFSYAFTETLRKRGDRACLPGCMRQECCGSTFRILAEAAAPLSHSQEEDLLEEYLGDAYDNMRLTQLSEEERKELVLQARTRHLSNKHGKHKQAYERHTTPPGYWRMDFPTTQEHEDDRQKAEQMEKKLIQERRVEALRKSGKYVFRDE
jgi:hypothetical protein